MTTKLIMTLSLAGLLTGLVPTAALAVPSATEQVRQTIDAVLEVLRNDALDRRTRREQMKGKISARFDFQSMSQRTLARNWDKATRAQQDRYVKLFTDILANTYLVAIEAYTDEKIEYVDEKIKKDRYAQVDTLIVRRDVKTPISYRLQLKDGEWLAYDVVIEGVSLIRNYRGSYQHILNKDGMEGLLAKMEEKVANTALY